MPITFRPATHADRAAIEAFVCAPPPQRVFAGGSRTRTAPRSRAPWADEAQARIHERGTACGHDECILTGWDGANLIVVARAKTAVRPDGVHVYLQVIGVSIDRQGTGVGKIALEQVLHYVAEEMHPDAHTLRVRAVVHGGNEASKALLANRQLRFTGPFAPPPYELWTGVIDLE